MQVYKAFFKIIKKNIAALMIYVMVFFSLTLALANTYTSPASTEFNGTKVNIAFINHDENSKLVEGLREFLGKTAKIIDIPDNKQSLQDALFFRKIEYIAEVPAGFSAGFRGASQIQIKKTTLKGSTSEIYVDGIINNYINTVKIYTQYLKDASEEEIIKYVDNDLEQKTEVKMNNSITEVSKKEKCEFYFNFLAYSLIAILILGICSVMLVFNSTDLKKRNLCSPAKQININLQMILGTLIFATAVWFIMVFASFILYGSYMFTVGGLLFLLNSFLFTLAAVSISYLVSNLIKSKGTMSAASNVLALGTSFISGVFVPQAFLGKTVLTFASFTPNYWYVKSNNAITNMVNFNMENLRPVIFNMLIIAGFAAAMLAISLVINKQRRTSN